MKKSYKYLLGFLLISGVLLSFVPWKDLLESKLKSELQKRGIEKLEFSIESIGLYGISFNNISYDDLKLPALSVDYTPLELISGDLREAHAKEITLHKDGLNIILSDVGGSLFAHEWSIGAINVTGSPLVLPTLSGKGTVKYENGKLLLSGAINSTDKKASVGFALNYPELKISEAVLPWSEGVLSTRNVMVKLDSTAPVTLNLNVKQVSLNALLSAATSNKATATGVVSGTLPVVIARDGSFTVKKGDLKADKAGTISLSPDVIPSDTPQVALLRDVLKDFHYEIFSMGVESADNKQLAMLLSLQGNNPDVYNGRVVKLNVHLTGDVIELVTQSLNILKQ